MSQEMIKVGGNPCYYILESQVMCEHERALFFGSRILGYSYEQRNVHYGTNNARLSTSN